MGSLWLSCLELCLCRLPDLKSHQGHESPIRGAYSGSGYVPGLSNVVLAEPKQEVHWKVQVSLIGKHICICVCTCICICICICVYIYVHIFM